MAYPQPVPVLKGKRAKEFQRKLRTNRLSEKQRSHYIDAVEEYEKHKF